MAEGGGIKDLLRRFSRNQADPKPTEAPQYDLDSELITRIYSGKGAIEALRREDISPTTRREVWDRLLRSVCRQALKDPSFEPLFFTLEKEAQLFYGKYYLEGLDSPLTLDPESIDRASSLQIQNENRNLAARQREGLILQKVTEVYNATKDQEPQPQVVSIAFGGNEPALLLASMFNQSPLHMILPAYHSGKLGWLGDQSRIKGNPVILVDDATKTGDTMAVSKELISSMGPKSITEMVVLPNPYSPPK